MKLVNLTSKILVLLFGVFIVTSVFSITAYASSDWKNWKQYEGEWHNKIYTSGSGGYKFGDSVSMDHLNSGYGTVKEWGCYLVAMAIQIQRSGVKGEPITPWDFIEHMHNGGYMYPDDDSMVANEKDGVSTFTNGKFRTTKNFMQDKGTAKSFTRDELVTGVKTALDAGYYPIIRINRGNLGYHFVAVDRVEGDKIYMFDSGSSNTDFFDEYGDQADQIRVFEADVPSTVANGTNSPSELTESQNETMNIARYKWNEGAIPGMPKPTEFEEDPVPIISYEDLKYHERESIEKWKDEVEQSRRFDIIEKARVFTMMVGILMLLLSLVYLVSYVFDRVTITEFKLLEFLTKGRLSASATGESTFFKGASHPKLLNVRDLIVVQLLLVGTGVLVLSGGIYHVLWALIDLFEFIQNQIAKLGSS